MRLFSVAADDRKQLELKPVPVVSPLPSMQATPDPTIVVKPKDPASKRLVFFSIQSSTDSRARTAGASAKVSLVESMVSACLSSVADLLLCLSGIF